MLYSQTPDKNLLDRNMQDSEHMTLRRPGKNEILNQAKKRKFHSTESRLEEWGVQQIDSGLFIPDLPSSMTAVADAAFKAVSSTLYGKNCLDPSIVGNALAVSTLDRRPVGFAYSPPGRDVGRLGIEIDGARYLMAATSTDGDQDKLQRFESRKNLEEISSATISAVIDDSSLMDRQYSRHIIEQEARALRRFSLVLASKLSVAPWKGLEDSVDESEAKKSRPILLFFATIRQALSASKELQLLQKISKCNDGNKHRYDHIKILCLGQDDIPTDFMTHSQGRRPWGSSRQVTAGKVDPTKGIILIVQPTDFHHEAEPPYPAVNTVTQLQLLLAKASIAQTPAVVISPRLTEQWLSGIEQSGYQQSSIYGGIEPPKGPTPWILRDFIPPVFSWIGNALELPHQNLSHYIPLQRGNYDMKISVISRAAITQSVMEEGYPWHVYAVEDTYEYACNEDGKGNLKKNNTNSFYMASTRSRSGRPTRRIIFDILSKMDMTEQSLKYN